MRALALGAALATVAGCSPEVQTVAEVVPKIRALDGKTVRVAGYLGECAGYECRLFADEAHWNAFVEESRKFMAALKQVNLGANRDSVDFPEPMTNYLGIGSGNEFDRKAAPFTYRYVVITGRITDECRDEQNRPGCTDRSTDLEPTDIRAWTPSEGAPAGNSK